MLQVYRYIWRDTQRDTKPVVDGEPSYEEIPHGLHDPSRPYWTAREVRRYAWWSALAGSAGFTYGHNSVMQVWCGIGNPQFGVRREWKDAVSAEGAGEMPRNGLKRGENMTGTTLTIDAIFAMINPAKRLTPVFTDR